MTMQRLQAGPIFTLIGIICTSVPALIGCKPTQVSDSASVSRVEEALATPTPSENQKVKDNELADKLEKPVFRTGLTATEWLTKQNITSAEAKTVDAILDSIESFGGPSGSPASAARWAEGRLQVAFLADRGLTEISPILPFKRIVTLYISGNKFTQQQFNTLVENLPNLKTVVKDPYIHCDSISNPKITCLE